MNLKEIKEIVKMMQDHDLAEVEIEREGEKLKLKKTGVTIAASGMMPAPMVVSAPSMPSPAPVVKAPEPARSANAVEVTSPMVGTFYRAPSPEAPPYIEVGQTVEVGQVVCIVEAMKLMNEIKSEVRGKVVEILANNAEPVEFGQPLFVVETV